MKGPLLRSIFVRYRKIVLSMILIAALCSGTMTGLINVQASLEKTFSEYLREYGVADAVISTEATDGDVSEALKSIPGITGVETRLTSIVQFYAPSGRFLSAYVATLDREDILKLYRWTRNIDANGDYVLMDYAFAEKNGISVGDEILVRSGDETRPFRVAGLVSAPETLSGAKFAGLGGYYSDIGYLYAPVSLLASETEREFERMMDEWEAKQEEYLKAEQEAQEGWEEGEKELSSAREELETREKEFIRSREDLQEQLKALTNARIRLTLSLQDLSDAGTTAADRKTQLEDSLLSAEEQRIALEDRQADLEEIRNDLNSLQVRLEDAQGQLIIARNQITGSEGQLKTTLTAMKGARTIWNEARSSGTDIELPDIIDYQIDITAAEMEEKLKEKGITPESLDNSISQAESGVNQLANGKTRIQSGITQITRDYLPDIRNYLEQTEQGLEVIAGTLDTLKEGISAMEDGLSAISEFEESAPENQEALNQKLQEVEDGIRAIYDGLEEGETALTEGRTQLEDKTAEAEKMKQESETELSEGERSLDNALDDLYSWEGYTPLRNEFLLRFDPGVRDRQALLNQAVESLGEIVTDSVLYEDSYVSLRINDNLQSWSVMAYFIPLAFTAIVLLTLFLFLSLMIRQSRRDIGILRALGFSRWETRGLFCGATFLMMVPALALGILLSMPIRDLFNRYYQDFFRFPVYYPAFNGRSYVITAVFFIVTTQLAALLGTSVINRVQPAETMTRQVTHYRPPNRKAKNRTGGLSPLSRMSLLSLKRNRLRFIASIFCIAASVSIMLTAVGFMTSTDHIEADLFENRIHYDCQVLFSSEPDPELEAEIRNRSSISVMETAQCYTVDIAFGEQTEPLSLMTVDRVSDLLTVPDQNGQPVEVPDHGIILPDMEKETLGIRVGDTVSVGGVPMEVAAFSRQTGNMTAYLSPSQAALLNEPPQYAWLIRLNAGEDRDLSVRLQQEEGYIMTVTTRVLRTSVRDIMKQFDLFAWIAMGFAFTLGLFIMTNTNQTNLLEQRRELCILRALGFQRRGISAHWFIHSLLYFFFGLAAGLPMGLWVTQTAFRLLSNSSRRFIYVPELYQFLWTAGILFLFLLIAHLLSIRTLKKWNIADNVRDME